MIPKDVNRNNSASANRWRGLGFLLLFFALFGVLNNAPLISDDFEFADYGYRTLKEVIPYVLYYGNGRFLGNLFAVWLINFPTICAVMKALIICGIIWALPASVGATNKVKYECIAALSMLLLSPVLFAQVFTWTSGFINYVPPTLIMLLCIALVRSSEKICRGRILLLGMLGFAGQLFVEHATIIHIAIAFLLYLRYRNGGDHIRSKYAIVWLVAAVLGALLMFAIPKVFFIEGNRTAGYRFLHIADMISYAVSSTVLILYTLSRNTIFFVLVSVLALKMKTNLKKRLNVCSLWYLLYPVVLIVVRFMDHEDGISKLLRYILLYGGEILYVIILIVDIWRHTDKHARRDMLALIGLAAMSVAPFLIISPFGERCIFLCYVLLCMVFFRGMVFLEEDGRTLVSPKAVKCGGIIVCCCLGFLMSEFHEIQTYDTERDTFIREQIAAGKSEVVIFDIPSEYAFTTYLPHTYYYQNERGDVSFVIVDYAAWQSMTKSTS